MSFCEIPKFFSCSWRNARKEHRCCECGKPIFKGERYGSFSGRWEDRFDSFKQHLECEDACVFIRDNFNSGECLYFGELFENEYESTYYPKDELKYRQYRRILARVKWRKHKGTPLKFIEKYKPEEVGLSGLYKVRMGK